MIVDKPSESIPSGFDFFLQIHRLRISQMLLYDELWTLLWTDKNCKHLIHFHIQISIKESTFPILNHEYSTINKSSATMLFNNTTIFTQENEFKYLVCQMAAILCEPQGVKCLEHNARSQDWCHLLESWGVASSSSRSFSSSTSRYAASQREPIILFTYDLSEIKKCIN